MGVNIVILQRLVSLLAPQFRIDVGAYLLGGWQTQTLHIMAEKLLMQRFDRIYRIAYQIVVRDQYFRYIPAAAALLATFLFQAANMAVYAYAIGIGKFAGLTPSFVSSSLGVSAWIAIAGSVMVILLSTRFGRLRPVAIAVLLTAVATWVLHYSHVNPDSWLTSVYWLANLSIAITWAFTISYLLGMNAEFDTTGQMAALGGFASKMGLASGPAIAAFIVGESNYGAIINAATFALVLCFVVVIRPARILDSA